ncbi:MAG: GNAT family N-acetyltransferase [Anaerolineae bacterium]
MLHKLTPEQYPIVQPLFEALRYNIVIDSVLDGNTPGWVFADDVDHPTTAFIWDMQDAMLVAGNPNNADVTLALAALIRDEIVPDARRRWIPYLSLHFDRPAWEPVIERTILAGWQPEKAARRYYTLEHLAWNWRIGMPPDTQMRPITAALLDGNDLVNADQVRGWVLSFWPSVEAFEAKGIGYCVVYGETTIASWCLSVFVSGRNYELGLATAPDYRGRNLAVRTAAACVETCLARGLTVHWHCLEENRPSQRVAEKVGFDETRDYEVYRFSIEDKDLSSL